MIWIASQQRGAQRTAFIYNIEIAEALRGKGYGRQALLAVEEKVKALGLDTISLHVFGHNLVARALYEKVGYEVTNVLMSKKLTHDSP